MISSSGGLIVIAQNNHRAIDDTKSLHCFSDIHRLRQIG
uniref:Uncharacterized protein n=1 Tax=Anguilla anguilla TaxID=7936 RepID=A0A0E9S1T5_ANGAN